MTNGKASLRRAPLSLRGALAAVCLLAAMPVTSIAASVPTPYPNTMTAAYPDPADATTLMPLMLSQEAASGTVAAAALNEWRSDYSDSTPTHYYAWCQDARYKETWPRDSRSIVMVTYPDIPQPVYNPVTIAAHAIHCYDAWLHLGDQVRLNDFLKHADWLCTNMDSQGRYPYLFGTSRGPAPWYSAMAQGLAISALTRAYTYSGEARYLQAARKALTPFTKDVSQGGVVTEGGKWLEEYPDSTHVLNGMVFALWGLWDLNRVTGDTTAASIFETCTRNLKANLSRYEMNGAVLYEIAADRYAHPTYYHLQTRQLQTLSYMTNDPAYAAVAGRWERDLRAYPAPQLSVRPTHYTSRGRSTVVYVGVKYLFRAYFAVPPKLGVTARDANGHQASSLVGLDFTDGYNANARFTTGALSSDMSYAITVATPSTLAEEDCCNYPISVAASTRVRLAAPKIEGLRLVNNPATPNGDGWADYVHVIYDLVGPDAVGIVKVYDARGRLRKVVPSRMVAGQPGYQWAGNWWTLLKLVDSDNQPFEDGVYTCVVEATNSMGTTSASSRLFISRYLTTAPALWTAPALSGVWAHPTPFTPNGDGKDDATHFCFTVSQPAWVTIRVFDSQGEARTIVNNAKFAAGRHYPLWNGRDASGRVLPRGNYAYYVFASGGGKVPRTSTVSGIVTIR